MGYSTDYSLSATGFKDETEAEFFEFKLRKESQYTGWHVDIGEEMDGTACIEATLNEAKWYDHDKDLTALSLTFPHVTIDLDGEGEESGDIWRMRFRNGRSERVKAEIVIPEFKILT